MHAGIALGSNIEPRLHHLQSARQQILKLHEGPDDALSSKVYETAPVDCPEGSASFLNAVLEIQTSRMPEELLDRLQDIEIRLGRPAAHPRNAPRTVDLDLLYCDNLTLNRPNLTLPHPRLSHRQFVLEPLADIRPELILPGESQTVLQRLQNLKIKEKSNIY